jgi:hypothetical protein
MSRDVAGLGGQAVTAAPQHCSMWRAVASRGTVKVLPPDQASISDPGFPSLLVEHPAVTFVSSGFSSHTDRGPPALV